MKRFVALGLSALTILTFSAFAAFSTMEWEKTNHDFGKIPMGEKVKVDFIFKNPGMIPVIINNVETSCGCTVPEYTKQPIPSGQSGKITVIYDAEDEGYFSKSITVFANISDQYTKLYIKGEVVKE